MEQDFNKQDWLKKHPRKKYTVEEYVEGILNKNRTILSQAITLIESNHIEHQTIAQAVLEQCMPYSGKSIRIGITGTPGVGKSTFIESFGYYILAQERQLAVLAIDPSSQISKGSILGDKTRMQTLSVNPRAFIRPTAAGSTLGGVAQKTRETIILCEAAGFDTILVETVGVGQSEVAVQSMVDFFMLLLLPNAGDELQGIKRGVMEMADLILINKADGDALQQAKLAKQYCENAIHLFPPKMSGWTVPTLLCSALNKMGIDSIWATIEAYIQQVNANHYLMQHRASQAKYWLIQHIEQQLKNLFYKNKAVLEQWDKNVALVEQGKKSPFQAGETLVQLFLKNG